VTGTPGHPDQFPYIDIWQTLVDHLPPWLKKCFEDNYKIMMARETIPGTLKRKEKKEKSPPSSVSGQALPVPTTICPKLSTCALATPPPADPTTVSELEDSGNPFSLPFSEFSTSLPTQSGAHPKTHSTA
jgi:hypothetical protein